MTTWLPELQKNGNPLYIELADTIERDIENGKLPPGTKLPPQRNIAFDIGVTVGTISRGYALACERGLVSGEIGRGTYVLEKDSENKLFEDEDSVFFRAGTNKTAKGDTVNFSYASAVDVGQDEVISRTASEIANGHPTKIMDYIRDVPESWNISGQKWLACNNWQPEPENIVSTNGAHAGAIAAIVSITAPGDKVAFEGLTYCSVARSTTLLGRRVIMAEFDEQGLIPEAFEKLCAQQHPRVLYLMPSVQNPTLARLPLDRRIAIAEIAHRYNVWIVEDMIYGPLVEDHIEPMSQIAPDRTFLVGGLSKTVSAGIRAGWISCPPRYATRVANAHKLMTGGGSFWLKELASQLVLNGSAKQVMNKIQSENARRFEIVKSAFGQHKFFGHPYCPYVWVRLPEPWNSGTFRNALAEHKILVSDEDDFKPARSNQVFHGVRIGFSSLGGTDEISRPMNTIRNVLESGIAGYDGGSD